MPDSLKRSARACAARFDAPHPIPPFSLKRWLGSPASSRQHRILPQRQFGRPQTMRHAQPGERAVQDRPLRPDLSEMRHLACLSAYFPAA
jgi:hypothetical protein